VPPSGLTFPVLPKRTQAPSARIEGNLARKVKARAKVLHGLREAVTLSKLHRRLAGACQCPGVFHLLERRRMNDVCHARMDSTKPRLPSKVF